MVESVSPQQHQESPKSSSQSTAFSTPISTPPKNHPFSMTSGYKIATATLSAAFSSLWGSYPQQHDTVAATRSPSTSPSAKHRADSHDPMDSQDNKATIPGGWGNVLSWGPAAASRQMSTNHETPQTYAQASIPSHPRNPLQSVFEPPGQGNQDDRSMAVSSPSALPCKSEQGSPQFPQPDSPIGAYATLSRLRSKASVRSLKSGSGFLSSGASSSHPDPTATIKPSATWHEAMARMEKLDSYVRRIVFQAGLDYETRPMVVLAACCLPDPNEVDYDGLLERIMSAMDLFVENDYTVIYFAAGGRYRPGWNWIWKAYRRLGRKFRKNLKKLYIVHPTFFTRSLLQFVHTGAYFVSPKFSKKVVQLQTLSALAEHVPLTQIDIPPEVLQWNLKHEASVTIPKNSLSNPDTIATQVFGVDLVQLMGEYGEKGGIPRVVRDCVEAILGEMEGIRPAEVEGIFRRSPSSALIKTAQESYDRGHPVSLANYHDPHIPAVLLKMFLRSLPKPIFHSNVYPLIRACPPPPIWSSSSSSDLDAKEMQEASEDTIYYLRNTLIPAIQPACSAILLSYILDMLHRVSQLSDVNKMDAANLATVISPNLVSSGNAIKDVMLCKVEGMASMSTNPYPSSPSVATTINNSKNAQSRSSGSTTLGSIIRFCIERYYEIFSEINFEPPLERAQDLVDEIESLPASASAATFSSNNGDSFMSGSSQSSPSHDQDAKLDGDTSGVRTKHRRHGSAASTQSGQSQSTSSLWNQFSITSKSPSERLTFSGLGYTPESDGIYTPPLHTSRSINSRDGFKTTPAFSTIGRISSGSLRLTKGKLGSSSNLKAGTMGASVGARMSRRSRSPTFDSTEGLTSQLSGVTLTGTNVSGTFSSPVATAHHHRQYHHHHHRQYLHHHHHHSRRNSASSSGLTSPSLSVRPLDPEISFISPSSSFGAMAMSVTLPMTSTFISSSPATVTTPLFSSSPPTTTMSTISPSPSCSPLSLPCVERKKHQKSLDITRRNLSEVVEDLDDSVVLSS